MTKLSDTQLLILSAAAQREDNIALPLPPSLRGGAAKKVVGALIAKGYLAETPAGRAPGTLVWLDSPSIRAAPVRKQDGQWVVDMGRTRACSAGRVQSLSRWPRRASRVRARARNSSGWTSARRH